MWKRTCKLTSSHLRNYYTKMCKLIPIKGIQASFEEVQVNRTSSCLHTVCFHKTQKSNKAFILELPNFSMTLPVFSSGSSNTYIHVCLPMHFIQHLWPVRGILSYITKIFHTFCSSCFTSPIKFHHQSFPPSTLFRHPSICISNCPVSKQAQPITTPWLPRHIF